MHHRIVLQGKRTLLFSQREEESIRKKQNFTNRKQMQLIPFPHSKLWKGIQFLRFIVVCDMCKSCMF